MSNSGQILTSDEVQALVDGMASGEVDTTPAAGTAASSIQSYSLVSTDTTSRSQLAALEMINDRFTRSLRGSLLTLLRQAVKVSINPFEVMTFGNYIQSIPSPCSVNIVRYPPLRGYGLITVEPSIVYGAVDSFFGGMGTSGVELSAQRGFTPTEERIIQLLLESVFENLREAWAPVYNLGTEYVSREINPAFAQVGEERETVVVSRFDLEVGAGVRGQLTIMYPFSALKPIRLLLRGRLQAGERDERLAARWSTQLEDAVGDTELQLVAQLASLRVSAADLAAIQPGDTIWFKPPEAVKVLVQATHLFDAEYGTANNCMAVRITDVIQPVDSKGLFGPESIGESAAAGDASSTQTRRSSVSKPTKTAGVSAA
jgi:flagellar motor switch protein FliM